MIYVIYNILLISLGIAVTIGFGLWLGIDYKRYKAGKKSYLWEQKKKR